MAARGGNRNTSSSDSPTRHNSKEKLHPTKGQSCICPICTKNVRANQDSIGCISCDNWVHKRCSGLEDEEFACLHRIAASEWRCDKCYGQGIEKKTSLSKLESLVETLVIKMTTVIERLDRLDEDNKAFKEFQSKMMKQSDQMMQSIDEKIETKVKEEVGEILEIEKRKFNIIVSNIPEVPPIAETNNEQRDRGIFVNYISKEVPEFKEEDIKACYRLGKKTPGKHRLIKIELKNQDTKNKVTKAAIALNKNKPLAQKIFVNNDMTKKQKEVDKALRDELKIQRETNPNLIIRNGKIVPRRPPPEEREA